MSLAQVAVVLWILIVGLALALIFRDLNRWERLELRRRRKDPRP